MILRCTCESQFQDDEYGYGQRVCNPLRNEKQARCTICTRLVDIPRAQSRERLHKESGRDKEND